MAKSHKYAAVVCIGAVVSLTDNDAAVMQAQLACIFKPDLFLLV